jgi:hypothetical protein
MKTKEKNKGKTTTIYFIYTIAISTSRRSMTKIYLYRGCFMLKDNMLNNENEFLSETTLTFKEHE